MVYGEKLFLILRYQLGVVMGRRASLSVTPPSQARGENKRKKVRL